MVKDAAEVTFHTVTPQPMTGTTPAVRSTVKLFDESLIEREGRITLLFTIYLKAKHRTYLAKTEMTHSQHKTSLRTA